MRRRRLSSFVIQSQMRIRPTRIKRNTEEKQSVPDDVEVLRSLDWHTEINIQHQQLAGTGERGLDKGGSSVCQRQGGDVRVSPSQPTVLRSIA